MGVVMGVGLGKFLSLERGYAHEELPSYCYEYLTSYVCSILRLIAAIRLALPVLRFRFFGGDWDGWDGCEGGGDWVERK